MYEYQIVLYLEIYHHIIILQNRGVCINKIQLILTLHIILVTYVFNIYHKRRSYLLEEVREILNSFILNETLRKNMEIGLNLKDV